MAIRVFWYLWLAAFVSSLFFVGRRLNRKPAPGAANAILIKREPYFLACRVLDSLKAVQVRSGGREIAPLLYSVQCLTERLEVESDFGCGNDSVTDCENDIAKQLQFLSDLASHLEEGDTVKNRENMQLAAQNVNALLQRRAELKKK